MRRENGEQGMGNGEQGIENGAILVVRASCSLLIPNLNA